MLFGKKKDKKDVQESKNEDNAKDNENSTISVKSEEDIQANIKEKLSQGWIKAHLMFEVIGKPADYVESVLKQLVEVLEKEKDIMVLSKEQKPAEKYEETLFSTFSEVYILIKNLKRFMDLVYDYMPSSIEIIEPSELKIKRIDANLVLNELATKLHRHDIELKRLQFEREFLIKKLNELNAKQSNQVEEKKEDVSDSKESA